MNMSTPINKADQLKAYVPSEASRKQQGRSITLKSSYGCAAKVDPWKCVCGRTTALEKTVDGVCLQCRLEKRGEKLRYSRRQDI